jgi:CheY-like chemotaxis protein
MKTKKPKPLIMIADHDEMERSLLRAILRLKGFRVIEAGDGGEILGLTREHRPDLLVVDLNLPRMSGAEAIREIRSQPSLRNLPIVAVSDDSSRQSVRSKRSTVHTSRPIEYDELDMLLDRFLPGRRLSFAKP